MKMIRIILKIIMWVLIGGFLTNFILRNASYSFYKGNKQKENVNVIPEKVNYTDTLTGYAYNLDKESDSVILCFGGSFYTAYNTVGIFAANFNVPFLAIDYYGTQDSKGKMNLWDGAKKLDTTISQEAILKDTGVTRKCDNIQKNSNAK